MTFKLGKRSLSRLEGVKPQLVAVVKKAIIYTEVDFAVTCGLRTLQEQKAMVAKGASQTLKSKHLTGDAVDVAAYIGPRLSWELAVYDNIADAIKRAAIEQKVAMRWGACWNIRDIRKWKGTMEAAMLHYIDARRKKNQRPFIDAVHFELN